MGQLCLLHERRQGTRHHANGRSILASRRWTRKTPRDKNGPHQTETTPGRRWHRTRYGPQRRQDRLAAVQQTHTHHQSSTDSWTPDYETDGSDTLGRSWSWEEHVGTDEHGVQRRLPEGPDDGMVGRTGETIDMLDRRHLTAGEDDDWNQLGDYEELIGPEQYGSNHQPERGPSTPTPLFQSGDNEQLPTDRMVPGQPGRRRLATENTRSRRASRYFSYMDAATADYLARDGGAGDMAPMGKKLRRQNAMTAEEVAAFIMEN